jgi:hypothetical protein
MHKAPMQPCPQEGPAASALTCPIDVVVCNNPTVV